MLFCLTHLTSNTTGDYNAAFGAGAMESNTTGKRNTAIGYAALMYNTTGIYNTATGEEALVYNTTGNYNTATGNWALSNNTTANYNTATGSQALQSNTTGNYNTATGYKSLNANTTGEKNTAAGSGALFSNTVGERNTAYGVDALRSNTTGERNTAYGVEALYSNTSGDYNIALGGGALSDNTAGNYNTAMGYLAGTSNGSAYSNSGAFGNNAFITASNQYRIGNSNVTSIGGVVAWSNVSDGRFKTDINENVPGLAFIEKLRPVTYYLDTKKLDDYIGLNSRRTPNDKNIAPQNTTTHKPNLPAGISASNLQLQTGFIAQEVETAAKKVGFDFNGVDKPKNDKDVYGLRYAEFVVPLVKAVQEQQAMIEQLKQENKKLEKRLSRLENKVEQLTK